MPRKLSECETLFRSFRLSVEFSVCSLRRAESATKAKLEKATEIKRLNTKLMGIKKYALQASMDSICVLMYCLCTQ